MAVDKLVDSTQLNTDLTAVANAIRTKGGTSAQLAFPADFVSAVNAIQTGGGEDHLVMRLNNTLTQYSNPDLSTLMASAFQSVTALQSVCLPNAIAKGANCFSGCTGLRTAVIGGTENRYINLLFNGCTALEAVDVAKSKYITNSLAFQNCRALQTVILRSSQLVTCGNVDNFRGTPFASGGAGGTIYIPKALYDHLGDGTALDYKAATNWSTVNGYGTITWAAIEGSAYENTYADGTPIPTS